MAKYRVYGNYIFSKILGEYEAASGEEAIQKALDEAEPNAFLCYQCSGEFVDAGELDEDSCTVDQIGG